MDKTVKRSLIVIIIVVIVFAIIWFSYDSLKKKPVDANVADTNLSDENTGLDNIINDLFDNVLVNETKEDNSVVNDEIKENEDEPLDEENEQEYSAGSVTSKEEKAVELVKEQWGESSGVYFRNESIDAEGRYIISVRDSKTTNSLAFFVVDVDKGLVTKQ